MQSSTCAHVHSVQLRASIGECLLIFDLRAARITDVLPTRRQRGGTVLKRWMLTGLAERFHDSSC